MIFFSGDGLMWFSSLRGLTSFDGSGVVYHSNLKETNEYGLNSIFTIAEDKAHDFYIGSSQGLTFFNRKTKLFSALKYTYRNTKEAASLNTRSFFIDKDETVYAGASSQGLFIYHPVTRKMEHLNLDPSQPDKWEDRLGNTVTCFLEYPGNPSLLWVGTFKDIYLFDKRTKQFKKNFTVVNPEHTYTGETRLFYDVENMDMANDSTIWFNIWSGAFAEYNTHTGSCFIYTLIKNRETGKDVPRYIIPTFTRITDGFYLLGISNRRPAVFDTRNKSLTFFSVTADTLTNDAIRCVQRDPKGNFWIIRNGILYVSMPGYSRMQNRKLDQHYSGIYTDELRGIYFDTTSRQYYCAVRMSTGVHVLDSNFNPVKIIPAPLFTNYYTYKRTCTDRITKDGSGRFWTTGWETYIMLPGQQKFEHIGKVLPSLAWIEKKAGFADIVTTKRGDILLKEFNSNTIYLIDNKTLHTDTIRVPSFVNSGNYKIGDTRICYDSMRDVIYLSNNDGIAQFNLYKKTTRNLPYKEIFGTTTPNQAILRFSTDDRGRIWLLEDKYGIRIIDPETLLCSDSIPFGTKGLMQGYFTNIDFGGASRMLLRSLNGVVAYDYKKEQSFLFDNTNGLSYPDIPSILYCNYNLVAGMRNSIEHYDLRLLPANNFHPSPQVNVVMADTAVVFIREAGENKQITLFHNQNTLEFSFSAPEFVFPERIEYAYQMERVDNEWRHAGYFDRKVNYNNLSPGKYIFHLKAQMQGGNWEDAAVDYTILIKPAWWQTTWFSMLSFLLAALLLFVLVRLRIRELSRKEKIKSGHEKALLELEAKALRAQMNPHFIFNCLNSIKSLIQEHEEDKAITYLTTFSKLIRTLFLNADKKEISLFDEIETCRFYLRLEAMRFDTKFTWSVTIDEGLDLKSIAVPALVVQPFIENAVWHGIVPGGSGGHVNVLVQRKNNDVEVIIADNGIGRETSKQNKPSSSLTHQSKGVNLTASRLELDSMLKQRQAAMEIIDKKNEDGGSAGTTVIIKFKDQLS